MKIATFNVNGIRASFNKGLKEFVKQQDFDIICIQELKAQPQSLGFDICENVCCIDNNPIETSILLIDGYYFWGHYAQKKGYSGVGIFSKILPNSIQYGIDCEHFHKFNLEGRFIQANFDDFCVISAYFPSGSSSEERIFAKFDFLDSIYPYLLKLRNTTKVLLCADFNIAHQEIDLKNWKNNLKNPGFLPQERQFISDILSNGYNDILRKLYPNEDIYTWWSQRGSAYYNDVGWRIDYHLACDNFFDCKDVIIHKEPRLSDHACVEAIFERNI